MSSFEIIEILISHGAKIYELNKKGQTPLDIAFMREKAKHAEYIELRDAGDDNHLQFLDWQDANKIVNLLMSKGAKTNSDGEL
ncbi:hypothetical protein TVAG_404150 [Trichomonas vaginalis G3]|uniref:Uncharacterized protein n=1 Tax=Trichomonas vaginalis (strain ATCC PRA-98 / G3) TaxID=412133 RepID=A2EGG4_TRIV3|nr:Ankyrin repeat family [Trichomonas vaginalis G3]EAY08247.1 hypothetical protein TVAG_404150 [Trichomonas vaginalis G3]KAI5507515.1 Ankyrin repeat family [Trichomonas vaginalis G3]|eukprot:XP_001320470.1 hypothetical protein [Trichomonas vaginalis G3]